MLLEASRRLREQSLPLSTVDREGYYGSSSSPGSGALDPAASGLRSSGLLNVNKGDNSAFRTSVASAAPDAEGVPVASFGALAAASATAAARLTAARISAVNAAGASAAAAAASATAPKAPEPYAAAEPAATAAGRTALTAASASIAVAAAAAPPAANASAVVGLPSAAASAAVSSWLAIEELLEEAAYSLSQELPGGQASSPLDALMANSGAGAGGALGSGGGAGSVASALSLELPGGLPLPGLSESGALPAALSALPELGAGAGAAASSLVAAVPGGDRLSEMLEDLLYSLSQDINLAATQEAVVAAATTAAAGLAGAAAELPRAAVSVYRSAAEAAAAAAAARAASARGAIGGGSGGTAFVVPDESQAAAQSALGEEYDEELDGASFAYDNASEEASGAVNPPWDPYGTIQEATKGAVGAGSDAVAAAASSTAPAAAATAADGAAATLPLVTAHSAAPTVADAATATAAAVVEAATTAAAGTIVLNAQTAPAPPPPPVAAVAPPPPPLPSSLAPPPAAAQPSGSIAAATPTAPPPPPTAVPSSELYGLDPYGMDSESSQQLDELTAALQSLLALPEGASSSAAAMSGLDAGAEAANAAVTAAAAAAAAAAGGSPLDDPAAAAAAEAEAALTSLTEALRRELGAVVGSASDALDADPSALAQAAGQAVSSALASLSLEPGASGAGAVDLSALPQDVRLSTLLGATLQSSLELVEAALGGVRSADSTLVGGVTIAAVMAVLIRALVSLAGSAVGRGREGGLAGAPGGEGAGAEARVRPVGVTALEAAAALNNDPQALLLDIRNGSDVAEQGLPDLRPFRRGGGAHSVPLPYCDFRTTPTLANPSGALLGRPLAPGKASASASLTPLAAAATSGVVSVSVDPLFASKFRGLEGLSRDSRVFLMDSYGVEAVEAVALLRSDPELERLLGAQGIKYVEGGFAGPEGWKLTGLPVMDAPLPEGSDEGAAGGGLGLGLDLSGLISGVAGLRLRYPSLFTRTLAVGAAGGAGLAVASSLDWGAVSRGAVGLAAAMLLTDRVLPPGVRPSGRIRHYLQAQLGDVQLPGAGNGNGNGGATAADLAARRRRTALLLRALDLAEAVGDAVVRAGGAAVAAAGSAAKGAMAARAGVAVAPAAIPAATAATSAVDIDVDAVVGPELETPPPPASASSAATIVLPHGMDSPQWSEAAELAVSQGQQQPPPQPTTTTAAAAAAPTTAAAAAAAMSGVQSQPQPQLQQHKRSASPLRPNCRLGPSTGPEDSSSTVTAGMTRAAAGSAFSSAASEPLPPRAPSPSSLAGRLGDAFRNAADAVVRAASPSRSSSAARSGSPARAASPRSGSPRSGQPDTLDLMAALATASALSNVDSGLVPGWPAVSFPRASAGQAKPPSQAEAAAAGPPTGKAGAGSSAALRFSSLAPSSAGAGGEEVEEGGRSPWSSWRQELEAVAPPPPSLSSASSAEDEQPRLAGGSASVAASRLGPRKAPQQDAPVAGSGSGANGPAARRQPPQSQSPQRKRPLRTSSPERAAAAGAAMRMLRMQMDGLDDDGLGSGTYGSSGLYGGSSVDEGDAAGAAAGDKRSGSAGVAAARMARGTGGLSPGVQTGPGRRQQVTDPRATSPRPKQPLRTASPQRAAAAAAAMRQLRAEMGLPPNDGRDVMSGAGAAGAGPVVPRDWRRELEAAAAVPEPAEDEAATVVSAAPRRGSDGGGGSNGGARHAVAVVAAAEPAPSRSPRNWRDPLEGRNPQQQQQQDHHHHPVARSGRGGGGGSNSGGGGVPADWRARVESGSDVGSPRGAGAGAGVRTASPSGRAALSAAERAERDARLQDWRAHV